MRRRVAIDCLGCGHFKSIYETELLKFGLEPDVSLVILTKKLVCETCGSKAVRAFRFEDDGEQREILQEGLWLKVKSE